MSTNPWGQEWRRQKSLSMSVEDDGGTVVCETPERMGYWEAKAVADFIAAAPRLYRALEELADVFCGEGGDRTNPDYVEARAALKAARGEE